MNENYNSSNNNNESGNKKVSPFLKFLASVGGRIVLTIVFAAIILGILAAIMESNNDFLMWIVILPCGYFGWRSLNKLTPNMFVWMPIGGWILYYVIKGLLSVAIGVFAAPIWLGNFISKKVMAYVNTAMYGYDPMDD